MKTLFYLCAIAVLFVTACTTNKTRAFIPGTYVNSAGGEFSVANDTLSLNLPKATTILSSERPALTLSPMARKESGSTKPSNGTPSTMRVPRP